MMKTNRNAIMASVGLLLAGLIGMSSACGREHRQGATEINQHLAGSTAPYSDRRIPNAVDGGMTGTSTNNLVTPAPTGIPGNAGTTGNTASGNDRLRVSQSLADQIAALDEVKTANVLVAGRTAYVAVSLHYGAGVQNAPDPKANNTTMMDVSDQLKTKIAEKVKSAGNGIDNVYVSANPDFVERMNAYAQDVRNGKPVSGFIKEFYNTVDRMFPYRPAAANPPANPGK